MSIKSLKSAIEKEKSKLIKKATTKGLYENFGQCEVNRLVDKYIDISVYTKEMNQKRELIFNFSDWCMNYSD